MTKRQNNLKKRRTRVSRKVYACDLFAGAGGLSLGAHLAGIDVVAAVEWDRNAAATYRNNLIEKKGLSTRLYESDINELDPRGVLPKNFIKNNSCDLLLGGPPCQGFSTHRIKGSGINDPRNKLLLRYFEFVRVLRPKLFLVENVPGLLWPRHQKYLSRFFQYARKEGYGVMEPIIVNARDYGVPQNRKRVFLLGYDKRVFSESPNWPPLPTHASPECSSELLTWRPASDAFKRAPSRSDPNNIHMKHGDELIEAFKRTPPNGGSRTDSGRILPCHEDHDGHKDVYGRINPKLPGPTMTTACINPSKGRFVHPTKHHGITVREAARLQTFPDWFVFWGGLMAGGVQVGNAVPVELARVLLEPLKSYVIEARRRELELAA